MTVVDRRELASDIVEFTLNRADGGAVAPWAPGAHVDLHLPGVGVRQYSLCGDPDDRCHYRVAVLRESSGRGGSAYLHDRVAPGATLDVSAPRNNFPLVPASRYVFVAGGIGITPLLPMIEDATARGADWQLWFGGRTRRSMAYTDRLLVHGERVRIVPQDRDGLLPLAEILAAGAPGTRVYCCGPEPLLAAAEALAGTGVLHVERFAPRASDDADDGSDRAFTVRLARSGLTLDVGSDESILDVLERAGVAPMTSCRAGTCASCETTVLEGSVLHRDSVLTAVEKDAGTSMMVCVSRAYGDLVVLDL
ncbi:PDR/VanB family oxidoreductase [Tsukamurella sp. 8F]|uniref:PDR/VanB family oxidoreductase n=1 Tax=unclassified Tsukamurella TaxID=2633480 RepID=UPI0023B8D43C|nr:MULTISPECIES: PDR/VanB family oxidoreductase [unclassified Tsukamurella]MDF0529498.1 PDR/VanB family oxidoreductase [Tsukamurella sp. 8J]MDF0585814.1 PDR/VanB family oxidoreductase [Tsukamurella sp. 8F]